MVQKGGAGHQEEQESGGGTIAGVENVPVDDGDVSVSFTDSFSDSNLSIVITPDWDTTFHVDNITTDGFIAYFGTPPTGSPRAFHWQARRY